MSAHFSWSPLLSISQQNFLKRKFFNAQLIDRENVLSTQLYRPLYFGAHRFLFIQLAKHASNVQLVFISNGFFYADSLPETIIENFSLEKQEEENLISSSYTYNRFDLEAYYSANPLNNNELAERMAVPIASLNSPHPPTLHKKLQNYKTAYSKSECVTRIMQFLNDYHKEKLFKINQKNSNAYFIDDLEENRSMLSTTCNIINPTEPDYPLKLISLANKVASDDQTEVITSIVKRTRSQSI
ncbi:hypothetical protein [Pelagibaculum spongiae]|uniref:Uncharacterized protein n=1 Tax=Pelagibaculum spongiae TaxID=2080658 RepID=A0A2V1H0R2_9GAMM|nr:hypothetical protein [Pelagibaculum spongiae]PVZ72063.1 hypothetical protein DC094_03315 [Pelagibaculum spongiae]